MEMSNLVASICSPIRGGGERELRGQRRVKAPALKTSEDRWCALCTLPAARRLVVVLEEAPELMSDGWLELLEPTELRMTVVTFSRLDGKSADTPAAGQIIDRLMSAWVDGQVFENANSLTDDGPTEQN